MRDWQDLCEGIALQMQYLFDFSKKQTKDFSIQEQRLSDKTARIQELEKLNIKLSQDLEKEKNRLEPIDEESKSDCSSTPSKQPSVSLFEIHDYRSVALTQSSTRASQKG